MKYNKDQRIFSFEDAIAMTATATVATVTAGSSPSGCMTEKKPSASRAAFSLAGIPC